MKHLRLLLLVFTLALVACSGYTEVSRVPETFTIVDVNPPKHFRVIVMDYKGDTYEVNVSKHCNRWREVKIGSMVTLTRVTQRHDKGHFSSYVTGGSHICPRS